MGKTAPQVQNIAVNAKDTISQLEDLLKAIPKDKTVEYDFISGFIQALNSLIKNATDYDTLIGNLQGADASADGAKNITEAFMGQVSIVEDFMAKFRAKNAAGIYKSFVNHSKIMAPVYMFMDDDIEDVEKSCQSLQAAIEEHNKAIVALKTVIPSGVPGAATNTSAPADATNTSAPADAGNSKQPTITPQTKALSNIFKELKINNPNPQQVAFLKDLMGSN